MAEFDPSNLLYVTKDYENEINNLAQKIFDDDMVNNALSGINRELDDILKELNSKLGFVTDKVSNVVDPYIRAKHIAIDDTNIESKDLADDGIEVTASHPSINAFKSSRLDTNYKAYDFINKSIDLRKGQTIGLRFNDGDIKPEERVHTFKVHLSDKEKIKVVEFAFTYKQSPELVTVNEDGSEFREPTVEVNRVITGRFFIIRHDPITKPQEIIVKAVVCNSDNTGNLLDERVVDVAATFEHEQRSKTSLESTGDVTFRSEVGPQFDLYFKVNRSNELNICIGKIMPYKWLIRKTYISDNGSLSNNYKIIRSDLGNVTIDRLYYSKKLNMYFIVDKEHSKIFYTDSPDLDPINYVELDITELPYDNNFFVKEAGNFVFIGNDKNCMITATDINGLKSLGVVIKKIVYTNSKEILVQVSKEAKKLGKISADEYMEKFASKHLYTYDSVKGYTLAQKWDEKTEYYEIDNSEYIGIIDETTGSILPEHFSDFHKLGSTSTFEASNTFDEIKLGQILIVSSDESNVYYKLKRANVEDGTYKNSDDDCKENKIEVDSALQTKSIKSKIQLVTSSVGTFILINYITNDGKVSNVISLSEFEINSRLAEFKKINFLKSFDTVTKQIKPNTDYIERLVETSLFTFGITDNNKLKIIDDYNIVDAVRFDKEYKIVKNDNYVSGSSDSESQVLLGYTDKNSVLYLPNSDTESQYFDNDHAYFNDVKDVYETPIGIYVLDAEGVYEIMADKSIKTRYYTTQKFVNILLNSDSEGTKGILLSTDKNKQVLIEQNFASDSIDTNKKVRYNYIDLIKSNYQDYEYGMIDSGNGPIIDFKGKLYVTLVDRCSPLYNTIDSDSMSYDDYGTFENIDPYVEHLGSFIVNSVNKVLPINITKFSLSTNKYGFVNYHGFSVIKSKLDNISDINDFKNYILIHADNDEYNIDDYRRIIYSTIKNQVKVHDVVKEKKSTYTTNKDLTLENRIEIIDSVNSPNGFVNTYEFNVNGLIGCCNNTGIYKRQNYKTITDKDLNTASPYFQSNNITAFIPTRLGYFFTVSNTDLYYFDNSMFFKNQSPKKLSISLLSGVPLNNIRIETLNDKSETIFLATSKKTLAYRCVKNESYKKPFEDAEEITELEIIETFDSKVNNSTLSGIKIFDGKAYFFDMYYNVPGLYVYVYPENDSTVGHVEPIIGASNTTFFINDLSKSDVPNLVYCAMNKKYEGKSIVGVYTNSNSINPITPLSASIEDAKEIIYTSRGVIAVGEKTYLLTGENYKEIFNYPIVNRFEGTNGNYKNIVEIGNNIYTCSWKMSGNDSTTRYNGKSFKQPLFARLDLENELISEIKLPDSRETCIYKIEYTTEGIYLLGQWNEYFIPHEDSILNKAVSIHSKTIDIPDIMYECTTHDFDVENVTTHNHIAVGDSIYKNGSKIDSNSGIKTISKKYPVYVLVDTKTTQIDLNPDVEYYVLDEANTKFSAVAISDINPDTTHKLFKRIELATADTSDDSYVNINTENKIPLKGVNYYIKTIYNDYKLANKNGKSLDKFDAKEAGNYYELKHQFKLVTNLNELKQSKSEANDYLYYSNNVKYKLEYTLEFRPDIEYFQLDSREYTSTVNLLNGSFPIVHTEHDELLIPSDGTSTNTECNLTSIIYNISENNIIAKPYYDDWAIALIYKMVEYKNRVFALCENDIYGANVLFIAELSKDYKQIYNVYKIFNRGDYNKFSIDNLTNYDNIDPRHWYEIFYKTSLGLVYVDVVNGNCCLFNDETNTFDFGNAIKGSKKFIDILNTTEDEIYALYTDSSGSGANQIEVYKIYDSVSSDDPSITTKEFKQIYYSDKAKFNVSTKFVTFINDQNDNDIYLFGNGDTFNILKVDHDSVSVVHPEINRNNTRFGNVIVTPDKAYILNRSNNSEILCFNIDGTISRYVCDIIDINNRNITKPDITYKDAVLYDRFADDDVLCSRVVKIRDTDSGKNFYFRLEDYYIENFDKPIIESSVNGFRAIDKQNELPVKVELDKLIFSNGKTDYDTLTIDADYKYSVYNSSGEELIENVSFSKLYNTDLGLFGLYNNKIYLNSYNNNVDRFVEVGIGSTNSDFRKIISTSFGIFYIDSKEVMKYDFDKNVFDKVPHTIKGGINFAENYNEGLIIATTIPRTFMNNDFRKMEIEAYNIKENKFVVVIPSEEDRYIIDIAETSLGLFVTTVNKLAELTNNTTLGNINALNLSNEIYRVYRNALIDSTDLYNLKFEKTTYKNTRIDDSTPVQLLDMTQVWEDKASKTIWLGRPGNYRNSDIEGSGDVSLWAYRKYSLNLNTSETAVGWRWEPVFNSADAYMGKHGDAISKELLGDGMQSYISTNKFGNWMVHDEHSGQYSFNDSVSYLPKTNEVKTSGVLSKATSGNHTYYPNMKLVHIKGFGDGSKLGTPSGFDVIDDLGWLKNNYMHYVKLSETDTGRLFAFKYMYDKNVRKVGYTQLYEYTESGCSGYNYEEAKLLSSDTNEMTTMNYGLTSVISVGEKLLAVCNNASVGVLCSDDNGLSWYHAKNRNTGKGCNGSLFKTSTGRVISGSVDSKGVYKTDDTIAWSIIPSANANMNHFLEISKSDGSKRILGYNSFGDGMGISYSDNNGDNWSNSNKITNAVTDMIIIGNRLVACCNDKTDAYATSVIYSDDYGLSWNNCTGITNTVGKLFVTNSGTALALSNNTNGIYRSVDGIKWINVKLNPTPYTDGSIMQTSDNTIIASSASGISLSYSDGISWIDMDSTFAPDAFSNYLANFSNVCEIKPGILLSVSKINGCVQYSLDYGKTWHKCNCIDGSDLGKFELISVANNGNVILSGCGDTTKTYVSRNDIFGFSPIPNSTIMDKYHVIDTSTVDPTKQGYSPDYIKDFAVVDYDNVLFVKAFGNEIYKYNIHDFTYTITNISSKSNDVAYILKIVLDNKNIYNNLNYSTDSSELDKFVFKEVGIIDVSANNIDESVKSITQYFAPHNYYRSLNSVNIYDNDFNNIGPKEFIVTENIKNMYLDIYKGFKAKNLINNRFIKKDQNIISDTFKHKTNRILGDVEEYLNLEGSNFRIDLNVLPAEVVDNTEHDIITTKPFYVYNGKITNVIEPFDPYKD